MRVTGGKLGGRRLRAPPGLRTRPTTDKVRQALFNILGGGTEGARVLDLYAGSGALGIEALSRGAKEAIFVEQDRGAGAVLQANLSDLGLKGHGTLLPVPVERALRLLDAPFQLLFADPPYEADLLPMLLGHLGVPGCPLLAPGAQVVVEHGTHRGAAPLLDSYGALHRRDHRCYGQTALSFYESAGASRDS